MYIPITKTEEKCAGQLCYGFNIQDKLEGCPHEKKKSFVGIHRFFFCSPTPDFWHILVPRGTKAWRGGTKLFRGGTKRGGTRIFVGGNYFGY